MRIARRHLSRTLAHACALVLSLAALAPAALASPPTPPLELEVAPGAFDAARGELPFAVRARALVAAESLRVDILAPGDAPLARGRAHRATARVAARAELRADAAVRGPRGAAQHVYVRATLVTA